ncbi:hypothetical protein GQ457_01G032320 [Hibiscus cannabinus]
MLNSIKPIQGEKSDPNLTRASQFQPSFSGNSRKRGKRYGSLASLQDKALSTAEKKKEESSGRKVTLRLGHSCKTECVDQRSSENSKILLCDSTVPSLKLLSWNIRGFGPDLKVTELRILIRLHRVEVAFIQESKKETVNRKELRTWYDDE